MKQNDWYTKHALRKLLSEQQETIAKLEKEKEMDGLKWREKLENMEGVLRKEMEEHKVSMAREHDAHVQLLREEQIEMKSHHEAVLGAEKEKTERLLDAEKKRSKQTEALLQQQFDTFKLSAERMWAQHQDQTKKDMDMVKEYHKKE